MKKLQYRLSLSIDVISSESGDVVDTQEQTEYFDTLPEAEAAASTYHVGDVIGEYGDGAECRVVLVDVPSDPEEVDYYE